MIAGKTHSEIVSMKRKKRYLWYKTISLEEKEGAMWIVEIARRAKLSEALTGESNPSKRPEVRAKISAANTGKIRTEETNAKNRATTIELWKDTEFIAKHSGENHPLYGRKRSKIANAKHKETLKQPDIKAKMSVVMTGKNNPMYGKTHPQHSESMRGENNPNWQGGTSFEPYGKEFNEELKTQIRERDNFVCQECHQTAEQLGRVLDVHHIDYDKKNNSPENLISLCRSCHAQTNFGREDWTEYFRKITEIPTQFSI